MTREQSTPIWDFCSGFLLFLRKHNGPLQAKTSPIFLYLFLSGATARQLLEVTTSSIHLVGGRLLRPVPLILQKDTFLDGISEEMTQPSNAGPFDGSHNISPTVFVIFFLVNFVIIKNSRVILLGRSKYF